MFVINRWAASALAVQVHAWCACQTADYWRSAAVLQADLDRRRVRTVLTVSQYAHVNQLPALCCQKPFGQLVQALKEMFQQCHSVLASLDGCLVILIACIQPVGKCFQADMQNLQVQ